MGKIERYDVSFHKVDGDKTFWVKVGVAFPNTDGKITIRLDTLPLPHTGWDGRFVLFPKETN